MTVFEASLQVPLFHLEDIYVTGILAEKVIVSYVCFMNIIKEDNVVKN